MALTYQPIATTTLGSSTSSYTFSSIPDTYTDLILVTQVRGTDTDFRNIFVRPNSDSATNYSRTALYGTGSSAGSVRVNSTNAGLYVGDASPSNQDYVQSSITHIMNYTNATTYKTALCKTGAGNYAIAATVSLWYKTPEKITSLYIYLNVGNLGAGSVLSLYGIKAA